MELTQEDVGRLVIVKAPATFQGAPSGSFGPEDVTGSVSYVHPLMTICYVTLPDFSGGWVDTSCLQPAEEN